eukprot:403376366
MQYIPTSKDLLQDQLPSPDLKLQEQKNLQVNQNTLKERFPDLKFNQSSQFLNTEVYFKREIQQRLLFTQNETHIVIDGCDDFQVNETDEQLISFRIFFYQSLFKIENAKLIQSFNNTFKNCKLAYQGSIFHIVNSSFYDEGSTFESNSALEGGSFYIVNSSLILNNTIVSNQMGDNGGFIYSLDLVNHTFYNLSVNNSTALHHGGLIYHINDFLREPPEEGGGDDGGWEDWPVWENRRRFLDDLETTETGNTTADQYEIITLQQDEPPAEDTNTTVVDPFVEYFTQIAFLNGAQISHTRCIGYGGALYVDNQYMNVYLNGSVTIQQAHFNIYNDPWIYETGGGFLYTKLMNNFVMYDSQSLNSSQKFDYLPTEYFQMLDLDNIGQFIQTEVNDKAKVKVHLWNNYFHGFEGEIIKIRDLKLNDQFG